MATCAVCRSAVLQSHGRRRLYGPSSATALAQLKHLAVRGGYSVSGSNSILPAESDQQSFLCLKCFNLLQKNAKMRKDLAKLEGELESSLSQTAASLGVQVQGLATSEAPITPSRGIEFQGALTPQRQKRRRGMSTPVRLTEMVRAENSPAVSVVVKRHSKARVHHLTRSLKKLGRSIGRRSRRSIARQSMNDPKIKKRIIQIAGEHIRKEIKTTCGLSSISLLRDFTPERLQSFKWNDLVEEMQQSAPTLLELLRGCVLRKKRKKRVGQKSYRVKDESVIGICAAILLRHQNPQMNLIQRIVSLLLYSGHAPKLVFQRLQKMLLCLSHKRTIAYVDTLGKNFDAKVHQWRERLEQVMSGSQGGTGTGEQNQQIEEQDQQSEDPQQGLDEEFSLQGMPATVPSDIGSQKTRSNSSSPSSSRRSGTKSPDSVTAPDYSPFTTASSQSSSPEPNLEMLGLLGSEGMYRSTPAYPTFKIVGDNLDKYVKPRDMRIDAQASTLHYFNMYAVRDRLDTSQLQDSGSLPDPTTIQIEKILPTEADHKILLSNFAILVCRVLMKHMPFFAKFGSGVERHIRHVYSEEMSKKSEVLPLGILPKSENKHEDMISILDHLHKYVPTLTSTETVAAPHTNAPVTVIADHFHHVLFGGDMVTAKRARGAQGIRENSNRGKDRLEGLVPIVEDWHAKMTLICVIWKRLYKCSSSRDVGTLYHIRNVINRRNVVSDPSKNVAACEEFFLLVVEAHIVSAAMQVFGMASVDSTPSNTKLFPKEAVNLGSIERRNVCVLGAQELLNQFIDISFSATVPSDNSTGTIDIDHVQEYAREVLSMGLLLMEFADAIREGDGLRILRCWRVFLPIFKATNRTNYSIEAFTLLAQHDFIFTPRMKQQLVWERTVNVHGRPGRNIPCDLHMEHLNRECKSAMGSLGPNISSVGSVTRIGESIGELMKVTSQYDSITGITPESGKHSKRSAAGDIAKIVLQLQESHAFKTVPGRKHAFFPKFVANPTRQLDHKKLQVWMTGHLHALLAK